MTRVVCCLSVVCSFVLEFSCDNGEGGNAAECSTSYDCGQGYGCVGEKCVGLVTLSGVVRDWATGVPVSGVTVSTGQYSDTTDSGGNYSISRPPVSKTTVKFEEDSHWPNKKEIQLSTSKQFDVELARYDASGGTGTVTLMHEKMDLDDVSAAPDKGRVTLYLSPPPEYMKILAKVDGWAGPEEIHLRLDNLSATSSDGELVSVELEPCDTDQYEWGSGVLDTVFAGTVKIDTLRFTPFKKSGYQTGYLFYIKTAGSSAELDFDCLRSWKGQWGSIGDEGYQLYEEYCSVTVDDDPEAGKMVKCQEPTCSCELVINNLEVYGSYGVADSY